MTNGKCLRVFIDFAVHVVSKMGILNSLYMLAQTLIRHKTEVEILNNSCTLLPTLSHFHLANTEVEVATEII